MFSNMAAFRPLSMRFLLSKSFLNVNRFPCQLLPFSTNTTDDSEAKDQKLGGFAKAFLKQQEPQQNEAEEKPLPFPTLLRNSKFIDLGDPDGKIVTGKIFHVVDDDLYIDFGWKFHTVCTRPAKSGEDYVRGATVRLRIKDLELSSKFLGSSKDLTLLEADCILLGLASSPVRQDRSPKSNS